MKVAAFDGSPRRNGNSTILLKAFLDRAEKNGADIRLYKTDNLDLQPCSGCLMCNALKRCAIRKDEWGVLSEEIISADVLAFSTPIYFHHASSSMKKLLDRFRSFVHVRITEEGIIHTPHISWNKKFLLFTAHGSSSPDDAHPLIELFEFINGILGDNNSFEYITAFRLAMSGQIAFNESGLEEAYRKLGLRASLAAKDIIRNRAWLEEAARLADGLML